MSVRQAVVTFMDEAEVESIRLVDRGMDLPTQRKFKDSGAMIAPATIARTGIMNYSAGQLGKLFADLPPTQIVKVMTKAEDLFCKDSIETYHSSPITINHPDEDVNVENSEYLQKGHIDGLPFADGEQLAANIVLSNAEAIALVEAGVQQLSSGHDATLIRVADEDVESLGYHAYKTKIRNNHVAIVPAGRAGNACIADSAEPLVEEEEAKEVDLEETDVEIEETQDVQLEDATEEEVKMYDQAYVSGLEAQIDGLQTKLSDALALASPEAIASQVNARIAFIKEVTQFTDADVTALTEVEAMRLALKDSLGKDYASKDDAFIRVRYDILKEEGAPEVDTDLTQALRDAASNPKQFQAAPSKTEAELSRERMIARYS